MKKLLIASAAALGLSASSALAADLGVPNYKAPPEPPPAVTWTGCYVDGGWGYGLWDQSHYGETDPGLVPLSPTTNTAGQGWLGRFGGGCDYQVSRFVVGAFADYDFTDLKGMFQDPLLSAVATEKESSAWSAGGRIGYLVTPSLLAYLDGGYTQARFDSIGFVLPLSAGAFVYPSQIYHGWFIGGGTEYSLSGFLPIKGLFWRTEYRYADYKAADVPLNCTFTGFFCIVGIPTGLGSRMQKDVQTVSSGLVWRFNFGGSIATRD